MEKAAEIAVDLEWVELMVVAKQIGLTIEEIREFLNKASSRKESRE